MKKAIWIFLVVSMLIFISCSKEKAIEDVNTSVVSPTDAVNAKEYVFDVSKEWDAKDYKEAYGQDIYHFAAPVLSPYKYTYHCEVSGLTIDDIANELGTVMMEDLKRTYDGKTFTVTEYKNLVGNVMGKDELKQWKDNYLAVTGKKAVLSEGQWLCTYSCEYKYTGVYADIGEMPPDMEWMKTLTLDGSGEDYVFIIQKVDEDEYIMRGMPKTVSSSLD